MQKINNFLIINKPDSVRYSFTLVSLFPLLSLEHFSINFFNYTSLKKKISIKQSYLLLTWFYYFKFIKSNKEGGSVKFCFLPTFKRKFTSFRAPIAHKTRSKEQFLFKFNKFKISFPAYLNNNHKLTTLNSGLAFVLITKKLFPQCETNFFFIKSNRVDFIVRDYDFFNYYKILKNLS